MANGNILARIANPQLIDPVGSLMKAQGIQQNQSILRQGKLAEKKAEIGINIAQAKSYGMDLVAATLMPDDQQTKMLQQGANKFKPGTAEHTAAQELANMPPGKERISLMLQTQDALRAGGILPEKAKKQKTASFLVRNPNTGETSIATGSFDTATGELTTKTSTIGGVDLVSKLGETGPEQSARKIAQKGGEVAVAAKEGKDAELIKRGTSAAEATATLRRGLELMETVKTGGVNAISLAVKQRLGLEGADEGELSNSLGKAVLSQLKETFGAAFTENEGKRLERIEGNFGKSTESNIRLLKQSLRIAENTARRARLAAKAKGDISTVEDIDDLLTFSLSIEPVQAQQTTTTAQQTPQGAGIIQPPPGFVLD